VRLDAAGNMYVPDYYNHVVYKVDTAATPRLWRHLPKARLRGDGALATNALLDNPAGVVPPPMAPCTSRVFRPPNPESGPTASLPPLRNRNWKVLGRWRQAASAEVRYPFDILIDASGNILFSDWGNARVRKITRRNHLHGGGLWNQHLLRDGAFALQAGINRARSAGNRRELLHRRQWNRLRRRQPSACAWWRRTDHHDRRWERNRRRFGRRRPSSLRQSRGSERGGA